MIKVMLVDDNRYAIEYMKALVDWNTYGYEIVGCAMNGIQAFKDYTNLHPDVIFLDIQMPGKDGIEVAKEIRKIDQDSIIILLTNYEKFEYARWAVNLNVYEYMLKEELDETVLTNKLIALRKDVQKKDKVKQCLYEQYLKSYLSGEVIHLDEIRQQFNQKYCLILVEQDTYLQAVSEIFEVQNEEPSSKTIIPICYQVLHSAVVIKMRRYRYLCLVEYQEDMNSILYDLKAALNQSIDVTFSIFLISHNKEIDEIKKEYENNGELVEQHYFLGRSVVIHNYPQYGNSDSNNSKQALQEFTKALLSMNKDEVYRVIDTIYFSSMQTRNYEEYNEITKRLLKILLGYDNRLIDYENGAVFHLVEENDRSAWYSALDMIYWMKLKFATVIRLLGNSMSYSYSEEVRKGISYIFENYKSPQLSVELVSEQTGLGVNQLNTLFKRDAGMTIGKYITSLRIKIAKDLLHNEAIKISDVYEKIGYISSAYFAKAFKKEVGVTPHDYRKQVLYDKENEKGMFLFHKR